MAINLASKSVSYMRSGGDSHALQWLKCFAGNLATHHEAVGVPRELSDQITALVQAFDEAYLVARCPSSNSVPNIRAKIEARNAAIDAARQAITIIKANPAVTEVQKINLDMIPWNTVAKQRERHQRRVRRMGLGW